MLVIAEDHQLCQVQETTELGIRETSIVHAVVFLEHAAMIIRHLHFNEHQWQTIDQQRDVRTETLAAILAWHLSDTLPDILLGVVVIYHVIGLIGEYFLVELTAKIVVVEHHANLTDEQIYLCIGDTIVHLSQLLREGLCIDVCLRVMMQTV